MRHQIKSQGVLQPAAGEPLAEFCRRVATSEIASKNKRREGIQSDVVA